MQVLEKCIAKHVFVCGFSNNRWDTHQTGFFGGAEAALTHNELVRTFVQLANDDWLENA